MDERFERVADRFCEQIQRLPRTGKPWLEMTDDERSAYRSLLIDVLDAMLEET